jgi:peptidyl-prolyl cis-trans isomerase D
MSSEMFAQRCARTSRCAGAAAAVTAAVFAPAGRPRRARRVLPAARGAGAALRSKDYLAKVTPTDADIEKYYKDRHAAQFQAPEQATIEYVVLDIDALKKRVTVSEEDCASTTARTSRATRCRRAAASHILVKAEKARRPT